MAKKGKTRKCVAKRVKIKKNKKGLKFLMNRSCRGHLLSSKSKRQLRKAGDVTVSKGRAKTLRVMLNV